MNKILKFSAGVSDTTDVLAILSFPEWAELYVLEHGGRTIKRGVFPFALIFRRWCRFGGAL